MAIEAGAKTVRWVDLFFDLVFVATAHQIAVVLKASHGLLDAAPYLLLFVAVLWIWMSHTLYSARFEGRGLLYNVNTFLSMIAVFALVVQINGAFGAYTATFALTYAFAKLLLVLFYVEALLRNPLRILYILPLLASYIASTVLWASSAFVTMPILFWALAFCIDFFSPLYSKKLLARIQIHPQHLPERLGLLTVVMLGEIVISLVSSSFDLVLSKSVIITLFLGMVATAVIFWSYFRFVEKNIVNSDNTGSYIYLYSHVPLYVSLVILAAAFKGALVDYHTRWLFITGVLLFILSFRALKYVQERYIPIRQLLLFCVYGIITLIFMLFLPDSLLSFSILTAIFTAYMILSEFVFGIFRERRPVVKQSNSMQW